jgi:hypothetical protein
MDERNALTYEVMPAGFATAVRVVGIGVTSRNRAAGKPVFSNSADLLPASVQGQLVEFSRRQMLYF